MTRGCAIFMIICLAAAISGGAKPPQSRQPQSVLFENNDFAIFPLSGLSDPNLEDKSFSGLLVLQGNDGGSEPPGGVWKLSGGQDDSESYYWANSTKGFRLTAMNRNKQGFFVVSKAGDPLNKKLFNADLPRQFAESVDDDVLSIAELVDRGGRGKSPSPRELERARAGRRDLQFKSQWFSSSEQGAVSTNPFVSVVARTVGRSGAIVQNCLVWYVPIAWEDDKQHWKRFDRFSSPTTQSIPVGQYKIWANHNGQDGTKTTVNPGDDLKPTKTIDLDVP